MVRPRLVGGDARGDVGPRPGPLPGLWPMGRQVQRGAALWPGQPGGDVDDPLRKVWPPAKVWAGPLSAPAPRSRWCVMPARIDHALFAPNRPEDMCAERRHLQPRVVLRPKAIVMQV